MNDPGRADEGAALGLSSGGSLVPGDAAVTVGQLFARDWSLLRDAGALTSPAPERAPVDASAFAHAFPSLAAAPAPATVTAPAESARTLLAHRIVKGDAASIAASIAGLAGVFERSAVRVTTRPPSLARDAADGATARHVPPGRVVVATAPLADAAAALVEVLAPP
jgi:hypothetical protein